LKAALWSLSHFATSIDGLSVLDNHEVIESIVSLGRNSQTLSVRHTVFHCLCLIASTQAGAENLRRLGWFTMPRSHHEAYPVWGSAIPRISPSLRRLRELDLDLEQDEIPSTKSETGWKDNYVDLSSSPPEGFNAEHSPKDQQHLSWLSESPQFHERLELGEGSKDSDVVDSAPTLRTPKHSLSRSIRKRLSSFTSSGGSGNENLQEDAECREYRLAHFSGWRIGKSRSQSAAEPGGMGDKDSVEASPPHLPLSPPSASDFVQTLSPIPSSASISVTAGHRNSIDSTYKGLKKKTFKISFMNVRNGCSAFYFIF